MYAKVRRVTAQIATANAQFTLGHRFTCVIPKLLVWFWWNFVQGVCTQNVWASVSSNMKVSAGKTTLFLWVWITVTVLYVLQSQSLPPSLPHSLTQMLHFSLSLPQGVVTFCYCTATVKGKEIPLQAWTGPEGSRFHDNWHMKVVSPLHWPPLPLRKYSWYSFLLEAESTTGS